MSFKKKVIISSIYALIICLTIIAGIITRNFINGTVFETIEGFEMAGIEETNGNVKFNVLIVGVDKTEGLSDVIMVVRYDEEHNRVAAMSIPRDTYVNYKGSTMLINAVYGTSGGKNINGVAETVTRLTGLNINYYVQFNVGTFEKMVDLLGGVEFDVPQNMYYKDPEQDLYINLKKGLQVLNGKDAESLVRFRGYAQADLRRVEVQQDLLKELIKQKLNTKYLKDIPEIYNEIKDDIKCNMSIKDMLIYGKSMLNLDFNTGIYTCTMPNYSAGDAHLYQDRTETDKIIEKEFFDEGPIIGNKPYTD